MRGQRIRRVRSISRREALKGLGAAAGAALLGSALHACGADADAPATSMPVPELQPEDLDIDTLVIVMMENRSFDHYFGARRLVEGRQVDGLRASFSNPRPDGSRGGASTARPPPGGAPPPGTAGMRAAAKSTAGATTVSCASITRKSGRRRVTR
jgi:phospholipase C